MNIGQPKRIIEVEPESLPLPDPGFPMPEPIPEAVPEPMPESVPVTPETAPEHVPAPTPDAP